MEDRNKFLVYKASAGSGKTFTLVKEYLKMALSDEKDPSAFRRILAITFTNKAAAEMKERVIKVLKELAHMNLAEPSRLFLDLCDDLSVDGSELKARCSACLSAILHQYSDFAIGTIDSFMHKVVKTFAFDLHLPVNFNVELDHEVVLQLAIEQVLEKVGSDSGITSALIGFTDKKTDEDKNLRIEDELFQTAGDLMREQHATIIRKLQHLEVKDFLDIRDKLIKECNRIDLELRSIGSSAMQLIRATGLQIDSFAHGKSGIGKFFYQLSQRELGDGIKLNSYQNKALQQNVWYSKTAAPDLKSRIDSIVPELSELLIRADNLWTSAEAEYTLNSEILKSIYAIALLNEISKSIDTIRNEEFIVHISEFNRRVSDIVSNEPAPFIFERLGEKYHHYLIDEFQDTSILQWQNLLPLVQNGLAGNNTSMIVGDGKQAIYRFRGGEVEQFAQIPEPYPADLSAQALDRYTLLKHFHTPLSLDINWRSKPEIIDFNNQFYAYLQEEILPEDFKHVYDNHSQQVSENKQGGYVKLMFSPADSERSERENFHLEKTLEIIQDLIKNRNYEPKDIALLTRDNVQGTKLASFLIGQDIPVISGESLLVKNAAEVRMLLAWMHILIRQQTELSILEVYNLLLIGGLLPYSNLDAMLLQHPVTEIELLKLLKSINRQPELEFLRTLSLTEVCFELSRLFDFDVHQNTYLHFFLEAVWGNSRNHISDIPQFLEYWEEKKDSLSIALPQDANAVRIMTVHKSKGLQFPVVILPFAHGPVKIKGVRWVDDEASLPEALKAARLPLTKTLIDTAFAGMYQEEKNKVVLDVVNLLYVATTRPEDALFIISGHSGLKGSLQEGWESYLEHFASQRFGADFMNLDCSLGDEAFQKDKQKDKVADQDSVVHRYPSSAWQNRISISRKALLNWDSLSEPLAMSYGKLVHRMLSEIRQLKDIEPTVLALLDEGVCSLEQVDELKKLASAVLQNPELQPLYEDSNRIYSERDLLLPDGSVIRPDRVVDLTDELIAIDYKTGAPDDAHVKQLSNYIYWLGQLHQKPCRGKLVYLHDPIHIQEILGT